MNDIRSCWECRYERECRENGYSCFTTYDGDKDFGCLVRRYRNCEDCIYNGGYCLRLKLHSAAVYGKSVTE